MKRSYGLAAVYLAIAAYGVFPSAASSQTTLPDPFVGIATSGLVPPLVLPPLSGPIPQEAGPLTLNELDVAFVGAACAAAAYVITPYLFYGLAHLVRSEHILHFGVTVGPVVGAATAAVACGEARRRNR